MRIEDLSLIDETKKQQQHQQLQNEQQQSPSSQSELITDDTSINNNHTKCTKMTDESDTIKNGIINSCASVTAITTISVNPSAVCGVNVANVGIDTTNVAASAAINNNLNNTLTSPLPQTPQPPSTSLLSTITTTITTTTITTPAITTTVSAIHNATLNHGNNSLISIHGNGKNSSNNNNNNNGILTSATTVTGFKEDRFNEDGRLIHQDHHNHHHSYNNHHKGSNKLMNNDAVVGGGSNLINNGSDLRSSHHHQSQHHHHQQQHLHHHHHHSNHPPPHQQHNHHSHNQNQGTGGRLQFFKDGKFILELARAREGEKGGWVSVPRKTYWPPSIQSTNATNYSKNESSASLSFSDDNSSIQSSPWQRDHCWKQTNPKKGISKEMCMIFKRMKNLKISHDGYKIANIKRRRPYDTSICKMPFTLLENGYIDSTNSGNECNNDNIDGIKVKEENNGTDNIKSECETIDGKNNNNSSSSSSNSSCSSSGSSNSCSIKIKEEKKENNNYNNNGNEIDCRNNKKTVDAKLKNHNSNNKSQIKLTTILQKLIDRLPAGGFSLPKTTHVSGSTINHFTSSTSSRIAELHHHQHVSPRKRILRELEKVTLEDSKRSRAKMGSVTTLSPLINTPTSISSHSVQQLNNTNNTVITNTENLNDHNNTTPTSNSTRLYSSYSIHSLLGHNTNSSNNSSSNSNSNSNNNSSSNNTNHKIESFHLNSSKDSNDPSYLRNVLSSPKSPENNNQINLSATSSPLISHKKRSPTYTSLHDVNRHNRSPSSEILINYGRVRSPEIARSPDNSLNNRYKQYNSSLTSNTTSSGFHPYLASPKYSPNNLSPNPSADSYKLKSMNSSNSPNHLRSGGVNCSRSPSAFSPSPQNNKVTSYHHSPTSTTNNRLRESSPSETISSDVERREAIPRTVPKKSVTLRQFSSPVSSPSVTQVDSTLLSTSSTYNKSSIIDQQPKRKMIDDRTVSPENNIYHSGVDVDHVTAAGVLRSSPVLPHSSMFYLYPPHGSAAGSHAAAAAAAAAAASSYIPPVPYYHPYAAAVAALRNPLWMHYQAGVMSSVGVHPRLPTTIFPYNGTATPGLSPSSSMSPSLAAMHLTPPAVNPWSSLSSRENSSTEDPVSLVSSVKDEHSSDVPLNLSKH